jgi:hypothetical protein
MLSVAQRLSEDVRKEVVEKGELACGASGTSARSAIYLRRRKIEASALWPSQLHIRRRRSRRPTAMVGCAPEGNTVFD